MNRIYFVLLTLFCFFSCHAEVTQVRDMDEVFNYFKDGDSNTLAVFDVDMVLIQSSDPAFQMSNMKRFSPICKRIIQEIPAEKRQYSSKVSYAPIGKTRGQF